MSNASNTFHSIVRVSHQDTEYPRADLDLRPLARQAWELFASAPVSYGAAALLAALAAGFSFGILAPPVLVGLILMVDRHRRGEAIDSSMIWRGFDHLVPSAITGVVMAAGVALGSALLVVPGMVLAVLWGFALHGVALEQQPPAEALRSSWHLVWENASTVLLVLLGCLGLNLLGAALVVGWLVTLPLSLILLTLTYHALRDARDA